MNPVEKSTLEISKKLLTISIRKSRPQKKHFRFAKLRALTFLHTLNNTRY